MRKYKVDFTEKLEQRNKVRYKQLGHRNGRKLYDVVVEKDDMGLGHMVKASVGTSHSTNRYIVSTGRQLGKSWLNYCWDEMMVEKWERKWLTTEEAAYLIMKGTKVQEVKDA